MWLPFHSIFLQCALSVINHFGNLPKALRRLVFFSYFYLFIFILFLFFIFISATRNKLISSSADRWCLRERITKTLFSLNLNPSGNPACRRVVIRNVLPKLALTSSSESYIHGRHPQRQTSNGYGTCNESTTPNSAAVWV